MASTRRGLGRGLGALIPTAAPPSSSSTDDRPETADGVRERVSGAYFAELPVGAIVANPRQPRQVFEADAMAELVASVQAVGLLQPIVVRPSGGDRFELVMGERRLRAAELAGHASVPAIVRDTADEVMLRDALLENLHRAQLNPLEEAAAYQQMLDDFGLTHEELAGRLARSRPQISNTLRLLRLSPPVQSKVAAGVLSAGHARALVAIDEPDRQDRLARRVVAEGISVRGLEELIATGEEVAVAPVRRSSRRLTAPGLSDIADRLSERFETRCRVQLGRRTGKIIVDFASLDDLQRILHVMEGSRPSEPWA